MIGVSVRDMARIFGLVNWKDQVDPTQFYNSNDKESWQGSLKVGGWSLSVEHGY